MLSLLWILIFVDCAVFGVKYWRKNCILQASLTCSGNTSESIISGFCEDFSREPYTRANGPDAARTWFHFGGDDRGQSLWAPVQPPATVLSIPEPFLIRFTGTGGCPRRRGCGGRNDTHTHTAWTGRQSIPGHTALHTLEPQVTFFECACFWSPQRDHANAGGDNNLIRGGTHKTRQFVLFLIRLFVGFIWKMLDISRTGSLLWHYCYIQYVTYTVCQIKSEDIHCHLRFYTDENVSW